MGTRKERFKGGIKFAPRLVDPEGEIKLSSVSLPTFSNFGGAEGDGMSRPIEIIYVFYLYTAISYEKV